MKRQALKFFGMVILLVMVAFVSALASSVSAQTPSRNVMARIPFEFNVGDKTLPAGDYLIAEITSDGAALRISNQDDNKSVSRLTSAVRGSEPKEHSTLVFQRYGERLYLSQVWITGERAGREMIKSGQQRAMDRELAKNNAKAETVAIAAVLY